MKEYKRMFLIEYSYNRIKEIGVSRIKQGGWVDYYPIVKGKVCKRDGLEFIYINSSLETIADTFEEACLKLKKYNINKLQEVIVENEVYLKEVPFAYKRVEEEYQMKCDLIKSREEAIQERIKNAKDKISEIEMSITSTECQEMGKSEN